MDQAIEAAARALCPCSDEIWAGTAASTKQYFRDQARACNAAWCEAMAQEEDRYDMANVGKWLDYQAAELRKP